MRILPAILLVLALSLPAFARPGFICGPSGCRPAPRAQAQVVHSARSRTSVRVRGDRPILSAIAAPFRAAAKLVKGAARAVRGCRS